MFDSLSSGTSLAYKSLKVWCSALQDNILSFKLKPTKNIHTDSETET